ncbi:MAG: beta-propeller domain-containing protein, partial [Clostridiales Family XIII bacterium]|nr:beta-propeller domain-containing protein [Clostridiales Family XIII bacterium]
KAILVNAEKQLIAFPADGCYIICGYDAQQGFARKAIIVVNGSGDNIYGTTPAPFNAFPGGEQARGLFIGDIFYVVTPNSINAYGMNNGFQKIDDASLGNGARPVDRFSYGYPGEIGNGIVPFSGNELRDYVD